MIDPMLEAARAHTKEPEEVDWEEQSRLANEDREYWSDMYKEASNQLGISFLEIDRLKDVILRLEQRCASAEGRNTELEQHRLALKDRYQAEHGLISCNDCGKLLYRLVKDLHKCEGQSEMLMPSVSMERLGKGFEEAILDKVDELYERDDDDG